MSRGRATSDRCDRGPRAHPGGHRRPGTAERWQYLRPPGLPGARRARLGGARARRARRLAAARRGGARRPRASRPAYSGWRRGAARWADRVHRPRSARAAGASAAAGCARAHAARPPPAGRRGRRGASARARGPRGGRRRRHDQRMDSASAGRAVRAAGRPGARDRARRRRRLPRAGDRGRRLAALRRGVDAGQGTRRAARRARDGDGPVLALRVCGQPGPRPGVRRARSPARAEQRAGRPGALPGTALRSGAGPRVRRRGPARARLTRRDLRHGRHRRPGPRPAGPRHRRRRSDRGARSRRGRHPAGAAGPAWRPGSPRRRAADVARRRRAARAPAPSRPGAPRVAAPVAGHRVRPCRRSRGSCAMSAEGVRVSPEWLLLREPADAAARSAELAERLGRHLAAAGRLVIHDLGGGSGAMGRWLAPRLPGPQHWVVHDRDAGLLKLAVADAPGPAADGAAVTVEARPSDITRLAPGDLAGASLIVASALLDMLTADELVGMLGACTGIGRRPVLLALTVVGRVTLIPTDPVDAHMAVAFNAHQRRSTTTGRLLGPDAVAAAVDELRGTGAEILVRPSPWRLDGIDADLAAEWFDGWVAAACKQEPALAAVARDPEAHHAPGARAGVVDLDLVAEPAQVVGGGQARRAGADDQHAP